MVVRRYWNVAAGHPRGEDLTVIRSSLNVLSFGNCLKDPLQQCWVQHSFPRTRTLHVLLRANIKGNDVILFIALNCCHVKNVGAIPHVNQCYTLYLSLRNTITKYVFYFDSAITPFPWKLRNFFGWNWIEQFI